MKIVIDMTSISEAFGEETTYIAGCVYIGNHKIICDGCTDRTDTPNDLVWSHLINTLAPAVIHLLEDTIFENGKKYELEVSDDNIRIKEIDNKINTIEIRLKGSISRDRLDQLIKDIDAQLMEDSEGRGWCDEYVIHLNKKVW